MSEKDLQHNQPEYSVSELSNALRATVEDNYSYVRVRGEISGLKRAASGHVYLSLKDDKSVINSICWRGVANKLKFDFEDGMEVICTGKITTYGARSSYQMVIENIEIAGIGALMALLEKRKKKLAAEGLFDVSRKQKIPYMPQKIGVITSPTGAVIQDILHRLEERFPVHVMLWSVLVQGDKAAAQVTEAIYGFNAREDKPDLIIIARGGGSFEDLWPFNDEEMVRAVAASGIPVISAVGHETDTTLVDYVADLRAPTPTAAAEKAVPVRSELLQYVEGLGNQLDYLLRNKISHHTQELKALGNILRSPQHILENYTKSLANCTDNFERAVQQYFLSRNNKIVHLSANLSIRGLEYNIKNQGAKLDNLSKRLDSKVERYFNKNNDKLEFLGKLLDSYDYHKVLKRGYSMVRDKSGSLITSAELANQKNSVIIEFGDGEVAAKIQHRTHKNTPKYQQEELL